jgi:hypothetical protein
MTKKQKIKNEIRTEKRNHGFPQKIAFLQGGLSAYMEELAKINWQSRTIKTPT